MGAPLRIDPVDHTAPTVARQLHAVQMGAYAEEARLRGRLSSHPSWRS